VTRRRPWLRSPRRVSARTRLTLAFSGLLVVVGGSIVASVVLVMTYLPRYDITALRTTTTDTGPAAAFMPRGAVDTADAPTQPHVPAYAEPLQLSISGEDDLLRVLLTTSLVVLAVALVVGIWLSWVVAGRVLRPLDHLTRAARDAELGRGQRDAALDDRRIALAGPHDEFHRLAATFDDMLARLDASYEAQRRFAANASHELRTPLATTQAMLDVALAEPEAVDLPRLASRLRETNARSRDTVSALLTLAEAESGEVRREPVDLGPVVDAAVRAAGEEAAARGTAVGRPGRTSTPVVVDGDPVLLQVLVDNLVGNAVRHGAPGGTVEVRLDAGCLRVVNDGEVLAPDEVARLREPFHRRAGRVAGSHGLGLSIVTAVCERHDAELVLEARPQGGLSATVSFPPPVPSR